VNFPDQLQIPSLSSVFLACGHPENYNRGTSENSHTERSCRSLWSSNTDSWQTTAAI